LSAAEQAQLFRQVEQIYEKCCWDYESDPTSRSNIIRVITTEVDGTKHPGHPFGLTYTNNRAVIEAFGIEALADLVEARFADLLVGPVGDYIRIFIKNEPHSREKADLGMWRLIFSTSLIDQIIDRCLFTPSLKAEQKNWSSIPAKVGFSHFKGGANALYNMFNDGSDKYLDRDMSSWDWTVTGQIFDWDREIRLRLWSSYDERVARIITNRYAYMSKSKLVFSDGSLYEQELPGIMKSGLLITLSINSRSQLLIKMAYCISQYGYYNEKEHGLISMGDDVIEKIHNLNKDHYLDWILDQGFRVKKDQCEVGPLLGRQFCSHRFISTFIGYALCPDNFSKHLYAVKRKQKKEMQFTADQLHSLCMEYGCFQDERFMAFFQALKALDINKARSLAYYFDFHFDMGIGMSSQKLFGPVSSCNGRKSEDGEDSPQEENAQ